MLRPARAPARGMSVVELLIGVVVGLFIVGAALAMFANDIVNNRRMLTEARMSQDLRAAMDVVVRDLRRAGYWEYAIYGSQLASISGSTGINNPNGLISTASGQITYSVSRDASSGRTPTDTTAQSDEQFGFRLSSGKLQMQVGSGNWQDLTDPNLLTVSDFSVTPTVTTLDVRAACAKTCCDGTASDVASICGGATNVITGATAGCPKTQVRTYAVQLAAQAVSDSGVRRVLRESVRVRNDYTYGACPP